MPDRNQALAMLLTQLKELEAILKRAESDLNTVGGSECVATWKARTIPLLAAHLGQQDAQRFSDTRPGPSFTNDLLEERSEEHTSELQSRLHLVCRLLLEKKKLLTRP